MMWLGDHGSRLSLRIPIEHTTLLLLVDAIVPCVSDRRARAAADLLIHRVRRRSIDRHRGIMHHIWVVRVTSSVIFHQNKPLQWSREKSDPTKIHPQRKGSHDPCIDSRSCCLGYGRDRNKFARRFHLAIATFLLWMFAFSFNFGERIYQCSVSAEPPSTLQASLFVG